MNRQKAAGRSIAFLALFVTGCSLSSDVTIAPLFILPNSERASSNSVRTLVERGEFGRAANQASHLEKSQMSSKDLAALGTAEMASGRFDDARRHLRRALDLRPTRADAAAIGWDLSQLEYLANSYTAAHEWALFAIDHGLVIKKWHLDYLTALADEKVYSFTGEPSSRVAMTLGKPDVPRIAVDLNGSRKAVAVIDSGAVISIIASTLAEELQVRRLGTFQGTFYGLLGEPIEVGFGMIDTLAIDAMVIHNIPVAIMPEEKLRFLIRNKQPFSMELLLGANLLKEFRIELDAEAGFATFTALESKDRKPRNDQNLFIVGFRPLVHAAINHRAWYLFVLDTGSEITFLNAERLETTPVRSAQKIHGATLQGLGGSKKRGSKIEKVEVGLDRWAGKFEDLPLYATEHSQAYGIIGQDLLKKFRVVIDFGSMRVDLHRNMSIFTK